MKPLALFFCLQALLWASAVDVRWNNALYLADDPLDSARGLLGFYENLSFSGERISGSGLSFYADARLTNTFLNTDRKAVEVSSAWLDRAGSGPVPDVRLGRFWDPGVIDPTTLDGLRLRSRFGKKYDLAVSGGLRVPQVFVPRYVAFQAPDSAVSLVCARASGLFGRGTRVSLLAQAEASGLDSLTGNRAGVNLLQALGDLGHAGGDLVYDIINSGVERGRVFAAVTMMEKLDIDVYASVENERVDSSIALEYLVREKYSGAGFDAIWTFLPGAGLEAGYLVRLLEDNRVIHEGVLGLTYKTAFLRVRQDLGFGGDNSRVQAGYSYPGLKYLTPGLFASFFRYKLRETEEPFYEAWLGGLWVDVAALRFLDARVELQGLKNRYYDYDLRVMFKTILRYSKYFKDEESQ